MRSLSLLSFIGLIAFIGFASIGRADVYEEPGEPCEQCEVFDEYEENVDPQVIVNNYNVTNYTWIEMNQQPQWGGRGHRGRYYPRPVYPNPGYHRPICRVGRIGWSNWCDLWKGNILFQRDYCPLINNSYWYLVRTGQCIGY